MCLVLLGGVWEPIVQWRTHIASGRDGVERRRRPARARALVKERDERLPTPYYWSHVCCGQRAQRVRLWRAWRVNQSSLMSSSYFCGRKGRWAHIHLASAIQEWIDRGHGGALLCPSHKVCAFGYFFSKRSALTVNARVHTRPLPHRAVLSGCAAGGK